MANIGVLGAGSWGTALSVLLHDNGNQVTIWSIDPAEVEMLSKEREHKTKLPGEIQITGEIQEAILEKDFLVLAVPSPFTRATAKKMSPYVAEGQMIVDVAKGIEETTLMTLSEQIKEEIPQADVPRGRGREKVADNLCDRCDDKKDGRVSAVCIYE